jgi:hypothetical protein
MIFFDESLKIIYGDGQISSESFHLMMVCYGAIQIICDALGGRGYPKCHHTSNGGGRLEKNVTVTIFLVISLVKLYVTSHKEGRGE